MPTRPSQKAVALVMLNEVTAQGQAPTRERFAIVCIALGREVAGELMKFLSDYEIEEIARARR
ncbi:MAG: flagellar motor switch protein FliG [Candidatus Latescibacterota bacterium]|jgi:flagellar motor switch protein FliG